MEELEFLKDAVAKYDKEVNKLEQKNKQLKEKIDKAIEYIKKEELDVNADEGMTDYSGCFSHIIKILKGENNE